jgi:hypothetical protein
MPLGSFVLQPPERLALRLRRLRGHGDALEMAEAIRRARSGVLRVGQRSFGGRFVRSEKTARPNDQGGEKEPHQTTRDAMAHVRFLLLSLFTPWTRVGP